MSGKFANDASSTLQSTITTGSTTIVVATPDAGLFPSFSSPDYFMVTVVDAGGNMEIMKCTSRVSNALTVVRGQEGTTAFAFAAGAVVDLRLTAGTCAQFIQRDGGVGMTGPLTLSGNPANDLEAAPKQYVDTLVDAAMASAATKAALGGDTFTGDVAISKANPAFTLNKTGISQLASLFGARDWAERWVIHLGDATTETGISNAGSNFLLQRFSDAGAWLEDLLFARRDNGRVGIGTTNPANKLSVNGAVDATAFKATGAPGADIVLKAGAVDGATNAGSNGQITTWNGFGVSPSVSGQPVPSGENAFWVNARTGDIGFRGSLSAGGTDIGANTKVLSGGSSPAWNEFSALLTSLSAGAIGSYIFAINAVGACAEGASYSGSDLRYSSHVANSGATPSGTWRCHGKTTAANQATLFQRIA